MAVPCLCHGTGAMCRLVLGQLKTGGQIARFFTERTTQLNPVEVLVMLNYDSDFPLQRVLDEEKYRKPPDIPQVGITLCACVLAVLKVAYN
jgi:hypothetical protein